jgi:hypothetical protein
METQENWEGPKFCGTHQLLVQVNLMGGKKFKEKQKSFITQGSSEVEA